MLTSTLVHPVGIPLELFWIQVEPLATVTVPEEAVPLNQLNVDAFSIVVARHVTALRLKQFLNIDS